MAKGASALLKSSVSTFRSTALTRTSAGDAATGTSGGGAGCWRLRKATTTATAAASSSVVPPIITTRTSISACFFATLLPYHPNPIIRCPLDHRPADESHRDCTQWINRQSRNIHDNFKRGIIIIQKGRHQYNFCKDTPPWTQPIYKHLYCPK